ncbi:hypothetical protein A8B83_11660 [Rhodobacteraceae bacterium EhC02]|nr:hypothetical protein A8B83_11660 [Rhodobacteraceae bacterium EhC02]
MHQRLQICFRHPCSAMPKPPTEAFRGALEQHWNSSEPRCLDQTLNGGLDMLNAHRDVPPVEDMFHLTVATHGIPYEVRESKLAIRDYRQQTAWLPSIVGQLFSHAAAWRCRRIGDQAKSSAHIATFNLADHKIQVSLLILRSTADMRTVQKNRQTTFGRGFNGIA